MALKRKPPPPGKVRVLILPKDPLVAQRDDLWPVEFDLACATPGSGPCGPHAIVVDYDASRDKLHPPARLLRNRTFQGLARLSHARLLDDVHFHQVNVWAIAERTLAMLEDEYLMARALPWATQRGRLILMPHAMDEQNAYYERASNSLRFGYFDAADGRRVHTCLSHDIVAHELGHAVLDGLKPLYNEISSAQTGGFHEYFGDAVAMMSALATRETARVVTRGGPQKLDPHSVVAAIASEFGAAIRHLPDGEAYLRGAWNRRSVADLRGSFEEHDWSEVLTGVYYDLLSWLYPRIRAQLEQEGGAARTRGKREYYAMRALSRAATLTAGVMFRGLDYCPPVDLRYDEYARAVLRADEVAYPRDVLGLRASLARLFRARGIRMRAEVRGYAAQVQLRLRGIDIGAVAATPADAYRFVDEERELFGIPYEANFAVTSVYRTAKKAKSGYRPPAEDIIEFAWPEDVELSGARFGALAGTSVPLLCGGTLVFDSNGNFLHRALVTATAQRQRELKDYLAWLVASGRLAIAGDPGAATASGAAATAPIQARIEGRRTQLVRNAALRHARSRAPI
jgi:hypothetical protein